MVYYGFLSWFFSLAFHFFSFFLSSGGFSLFLPISSEVFGRGRFLYFFLGDFAGWGVFYLSFVSFIGLRYFVGPSVRGGIESYG